MAIVETLCANPICCNKENVWRSQQFIPKTAIPAGNLLLSFGILTAGATASKVLRIFQNMGLACISLKTLMKHQQVNDIF